MVREFNRFAQRELLQSVHRSFRQERHSLVDEITVKTSLPEVDILVVDRLNFPQNDLTFDGDPPRRQLSLEASISLPPSRVRC